MIKNIKIWWTSVLISCLNVFHFTSDFAFLVIYVTVFPLIYFFRYFEMFISTVVLLIMVCLIIPFKEILDVESVDSILGFILQIYKYGLIVTLVLPLTLIIPIYTFFSLAAFFFDNELFFPVDVRLLKRKRHLFDLENYEGKYYLILRPLTEDTLKVARIKTVKIIEESSAPFREWQMCAGVIKHREEGETVVEFFNEFVEGIRYAKSIFLTYKRRNENRANIIIESHDITWFKNFRLLANGVNAIFVFPSNTPGIIKEIEYISQHNFWFKTFVVIPKFETKNSDQNIEDIWKQYIEKLNKMTGYCLPTDVERELLFFLPNPDLSIKLKFYSWGDLNEYINIIEINRPKTFSSEVKDMALNSGKA